MPHWFVSTQILQFTAENRLLAFHSHSYAILDIRDRDWLTYVPSLRVIYIPLHSSLIVYLTIIIFPWTLTFLTLYIAFLSRCGWADGKRYREKPSQSTHTKSIRLVLGRVALPVLFLCPHPPSPPPPALPTYAITPPSLPYIPYMFYPPLSPAVPSTVHPPLPSNT